MKKSLVTVTTVYLLYLSIYLLIIQKIKIFYFFKKQDFLFIQQTTDNISSKFQIKMLSIRAVIYMHSRGFQWGSGL